MSPLAKFNLNGEETPIPPEFDGSLLGLLRDEKKLTGAKYGCGEGQCGACTVIIDGKAARSCQTDLSAATGRSVRTIESLEKSGTLHPVQRAFLEIDAFQCGYCTPGMILSAVALLEEHPRPDDAQILAAMNGNICRCGGYNRVRKAIRRASELLEKEAS